MWAYGVHVVLSVAAAVAVAGGVAPESGPGYLLYGDTATATATRDVLNFDFAWRHYYGDPGRPAVCPQIEKGVNYGTGGAMTHQANASACCLQCSTPGIVAWDWNEGNGECYCKQTATPKVTADRYSGVLPARNDTPAAAKPGFDDSAWALVNAPHDMELHQAFDQTQERQNGFIARGNGWYRKHFKLPAAWQGSAVWLYFEGAFHESTLWLNGAKVTEHVCGYTSFWIRLDKVEGVQYGDAENVLAIQVLATEHTGWWYESGGLFRHQYLVRSNTTFLKPDRSWAFANLTGPVQTGATPAAGQRADALFHVQGEVAGTFSAQDRGGAGAAGDELVVAIAISQGTSHVGSATAVVHSGRYTTAVAVSSAALWSIASPSLYTVTATLMFGAEVIDEISFTTGARTMEFTADHGLQVNGHHVKVRGFCDHSNFGGVGIAVPDRVNLFRVQMLRTVGANAWRMAHNPPIPARLDFMDRLGMMALDENRDFGGAQGQGGTTSESAAAQVLDMGDLVQRDRSHPSIMAWSFCNEVGCRNESAAKPFREISYALDGTRPVTQNHLGTDVSTAYLDIQGFSHKSASTFSAFHTKYPDKPTMATECCSCFSQRGEDADLTPASKEAANASRPGLFYNNLIQECTASQVETSDAPDYISGTFVWSGFDYIGESQGWPQSIKCRGTVADVAGFPKETGYWLRAWWLSNISTADYGRPPLAGLDHTLFIVESWTPPAGTGTNRSINVYGNAASVKLMLGGQSLGRQTMPFFGKVSFSVPYKIGSLTAYGYGPGGELVANHTIEATSPPAAIRLSLDAPSPATGSGSALLADGEDTAMVRAEVVDAQGRVVPLSVNAVRFAVVSGDATVWGTHNGDPASQVNMLSDTHPAYHGLVRAFVRTTLDAATTPQHRRLRLAVEVDRSDLARVLDPDAPDAAAFAPPAIVVEATSPGLASARLTIPVTTDPAARPMAVAQRSVRY